MTQAESPILKPCPFCGSAARLLGGGLSQDPEEVWCANNKCLARSRPSAWQSRAHSTPDSSLIETILLTVYDTWGGSHPKWKEEQREKLRKLFAKHTPSPDRDGLIKKLEAIIGTLRPVQEQDWHGKWRIIRAIETAEAAIAAMGGASETGIGNHASTAHLQDHALTPPASEQPENKIAAGLQDAIAGRGKVTRYQVTDGVVTEQPVKLTEPTTVTVSRGVIEAYEAAKIAIHAAPHGQMKSDAIPDWVDQSNDGNAHD